MTLAGPSAALGTGAPRAGNRCEKAIALPGVLGLPEIRVWLARPEGLAVRDADATDLQRARIRMNEEKPRRD